jgi:hypothetical protein
VGSSNYPQIGLSIVENNRHGTSIVRTRLPDALSDEKTFQILTDKDQREAVSSDSAGYPGGHTPELVRLSPESGEAEVAEILRRSFSVVIRGAGSSLTGGVTPFGEVVVDMSLRNRVVARGENWITVQTGIVLRALQEQLAAENKYYPCMGYLDHPFKNRHVETEKDLLFPACKPRRVGVQSDVVNSILMLEHQ